MLNVSKSTNVMVKIGLLSAIAVVLMLFDFPILPAFNWLKIDGSDIPAVIAAFAYGPLAGFAVEGMKIFLNFLIKGTQTGGIGEFANLIIGASFVIPAGFIYCKNKTKKTAIISLMVGTIVMSVVGALANYYILVPLYANFLPALKENAYVMKYLVYGVLPFNLIKGVVISGIMVLIYKRVSVLLKVENFRSAKLRTPKKTV